MDLKEMHSRSVAVGECLVWTGATAVYNRGHTTTTVHRKAYELIHGPVPEGYRIKHTCKRTGCIKDEHLVLYKVMPKKEPSYSTIFRDYDKLNLEMVKKIRRECNGFGVSPKVIAPMLGISPITVRAVARGEIWKMLP